ncbi:MAG: hypothetical protein PHY82_08830 [Lentisphaeria bacterium]|nr:hypothetical protein [Lentisphaeria bacterium]
MKKNISPSFNMIRGKSIATGPVAPLFLRHFKRGSAYAPSQPGRLRHFLNPHPAPRPLLCFFTPNG